MLLSLRRYILLWLTVLTLDGFLDRKLISITRDDIGISGHIFKFDFGMIDELDNNGLFIPSILFKIWVIHTISIGTVFNDIFWH